MSVPFGGNNNTNETGATVVQNVTGTVFYNDGKTPLVLNDRTNGFELTLNNYSSDALTDVFTTDSNGTFISSNVSAGKYTLSAWDGTGNRIDFVDITIPSGISFVQNLTTSRISTN
jgi:hypothetical protein